MAHDAVCHLVLSVWIRKHLQNVHALGSMYIMNVESMPTVLDRLVSNSRVSPCIEYDAHRSELPLILNVSRYESGSLFNYQESFEMSSRSLYTPRAMRGLESLAFLAEIRLNAAKRAQDLLLKLQS